MFFFEWWLFKYNLDFSINYNLKNFFLFAFAVISHHLLKAFNSVNDACTSYSPRKAFKWIMQIAVEKISGVGHQRRTGQVICRSLQKSDIKKDALLGYFFNKLFHIYFFDISPIFFIIIFLYYLILFNFLSFFPYFFCIIYFIYLHFALLHVVA